jgi:hypothetical protein
MPKEPKTYRRLPGRGTTLTHYVRLFEGRDHLLQVSSTGYSELYKRFYFRDIQAITIRKSHGGIVWTVFWIVLTLVFLLPGFDLSGPGAVVMWSIAAVFLACLMVHLILGPTCVCHVRTAVQIERLPTLRRVRAARKTINRIKPLIAEVQGPFSTEELTRKMHPAGVARSFQTAAPAQESVSAPPVISPAENVPEVNP